MKKRGFLSVCRNGNEILRVYLLDTISYDTFSRSLPLFRKVTIASLINVHSTADNKGVPMCGENVKLYSAAPTIDCNKTSEVVSVIVAHGPIWRPLCFRFPYLLSQNAGCNM